MRLASPEETNNSAFSTFLITLDVVTFSIFVASGVACVYLMKVAGEVKPEEETNGNRNSDRRRRSGSTQLPTSVQIAPKRDLLNMTLIRKALDVHRVTATQKLHEQTSLASMNRVKSQHKMAAIRMTARLKKRKRESQLRIEAELRKTNKERSAEGTGGHTSEQANGKDSKDNGTCPALPTLELNLGSKSGDTKLVIPPEGGHPSKKEDEAELSVEEIRLSLAKYIGSRKKLVALVAKLHARENQGVHNDVLSKKQFCKVVKSVCKKMGSRPEKKTIDSAWLSVCLVDAGTAAEGDALGVDVLGQWLQVE